MSIIKKGKANFLIIFLASLFFYLPILLNPNFILNRGNDLQEFFWPVFYFVKQQIYKNYTLPLWNNLFFSGTPLLPDPQSPLFYPPNIIFLVFPMGTGFTVAFFFHAFLGGIGAYLVARDGLKLSKFTCLFTAFLYILTPRLFGYLEAGHFGLITSFGWLPFVVLSILKLAESPDKKWSILLAISLAAIFYTHTLTFILGVAVAIIFFLISLFFQHQERFWLKSLFFFIIGIFFTFGLIAITLLPQLEWVPKTTRFLLLTDKDVYPKWGSYFEFLRAVFAPWVRGKEEIWELDTEKWLVLGILPSLLALWGFLNLQKRLKIALIMTLGSTLFLVLNNISPLYNFLLSQNWYVLMRVSTRIWFVPILIIIFLAGFGFQKLTQNIKNKMILGLIGLLTIGEYLSLSWFWLYKPIPSPDRFAPKAVYEFLKRDKDRFRVFCVTRCLSQRTAVEYGLELTEGYNTLQQKNYYNQFIQLDQIYWKHYTLSLPPFEIYNTREIQPYAPNLAEYNIKYIISPYKLKDQRLILEKEVNGYLIYRDSIVLPRAYFWSDSKGFMGNALITKYTPNFIQVDIPNQLSDQVILAEVYNPGWKAYLNGNQKALIKETTSALRLINIEKDTRFVDFKYEPEGYKLGQLITSITLFILLTMVIKQWKRL